MKKGAIFSEAHKKKLSEVAKKSGRKPPSRKGCTPWNKGVKGLKTWNKGIPMKEESKVKLRESINRLYKERPEIKVKISKAVKKRWENPGYRIRCEEAQKGEKSTLWKGGIQYEPYEKNFTKEFRKSIRMRDNYTCKLCGMNGKSVHHIDYNKRNSSPSNLVTLCFKCHSKTNHNRQDWIKTFTVAETK